MKPEPGVRVLARNDRGELLIGDPYGDARIQIRIGLHETHTVPDLWTVPYPTAWHLFASGETWEIIQDPGPVPEDWPTLAFPPPIEA